jgi:ubiquinone/menaquinone biosynthesis methyltransferase
VSLARSTDVRGMFDRIAPTYDLANRVLSGGVDTLWRKAAMSRIPLDGTVLDLCAGTLDFTLLLTARGAKHVHALDLSPGMLEVGQKRLQPGAPVTLTVGDAQDLPFDNGLFIGGVCSFGIRNVPDNSLALEELFRVLKPGGRFVVLEFFRPTRWDAKAFHTVFNKVVLPNVGGLISGEREAYAYLADSMEQYLTRTQFCALAERAGFTVLEAKEMLPPVASLVVLEKPA